MEDDTCRPATVDDLLSMIKSLNDNNAEYILIGGYALYAHGIHRATEDIDILVPSREKSAKPIIEALMVLPDQTAKQLEPEWFTEGETIRLADAFVVDLVFNASQQTYDTLKPYIETISVNGIQITTLNIQGLILSKQTMREKDVMDRKMLEIILNRISNTKPTEPLKPVLSKRR